MEALGEKVFSGINKNVISKEEKYQCEAFLLCVFLCCLELFRFIVKHRNVNAKKEKERNSKKYKNGARV